MVNDLQDRLSKARQVADFGTFKVWDQKADVFIYIGLDFATLADNQKLRIKITQAYSPLFAMISKISWSASRRSLTS